MKMNTKAEAVVNRLKEQGLTLATAESCTGGLIGKLLTDVPGASAIYKGGVISYVNEIKRCLLGVEQETLDVCTAVSRETAHEMARGARERLMTDCAVSVTAAVKSSADTAAEALTDKPSSRSKAISRLSPCFLIRAMIYPPIFILQCFLLITCP